MRVDWKAVLGVNELNLSSEFSQLPGYMGEFNSLLAEAQDAEMRAKVELGQTEARAAGEVRAVLTAQSGGKKPPESQVEQAVLLRADVQKAQDKHIEKTTERNRIKAVCEGLEAKRSMLMSLGAFQRAEMGDMVLRERAIEKNKG